MYRLAGRERRPGARWRSAAPQGAPLVTEMMPRSRTSTATASTTTARKRPSRTPKRRWRRSRGAADLNGDGTISVTEAAQSGWTGGVNCNHGGYVSQVAQADDEAATSRRPGRGVDEEVDEEVDEATARRTRRDEERRTPTRPKKRLARKSRRPNSIPPPTRASGTMEPGFPGLRTPWPPAGRTATTAARSAKPVRRPRRAPGARRKEWRSRRQHAMPARVSARRRSSGQGCEVPRLRQAELARTITSPKTRTAGTPAPSSL